MNKNEIETKDLEVIWNALHAYREDCIPEGEPAYDEEWDRICLAMGSFVSTSPYPKPNDELIELLLSLTEGDLMRICREQLMNKSQMNQLLKAHENFMRECYEL